MTTILAPPVRTYAFSGGFGMRPIHYRKDNGRLKVERFPVFRSGTFRDSWGDQSTYEDLHIKQMLENFGYLRNNSLFDDVPVRDGHPGFLINGTEGTGKVIGWHTDVATEKLKAPHDGGEYEYFFVDFELTDPDGAAKYENGTFRNRSSEIGRYKTNAGAEFWPVYMGFAFVDIPAVEGLKFSSVNGNPGADGTRRYFIMDKEMGVTHNPQNQQGAGAPGGNQLPFAPPHVFSVNGQQVADYAAVQAHINMLESFRSDIQEQARKDFVASLARENKIAATQIAATEEFASKLTPEMFAAWKETWTAAPATQVLGMHGQPVTNPNGQVNPAASQPNPQEDQYSVWRATVEQFKMAGLPKDKIKETPSYKNLVAAGQTVNL